MIVNKLNWYSSEALSNQQLKDLDRRMSEFYSSIEKRFQYQSMIDDVHQNAADPTSEIADHVITFILENKVQNLIEIGCGSGKIYDKLIKRGFSGNYTGVEMAEYVIEENKRKYPSAQWQTASAYNFIQSNNSYDCCLAFYVMEHLVYPLRALTQMTAGLKTNGKLVLVFPDFCSTGIVPSQKIGFNYGKGAKEKIKKRLYLDALVSFFEGWQMRKKLKHLNNIYGPFVLNIDPYCLKNPDQRLIPDIDAVYLANKIEIKKWAEANFMTVSFPKGTEGLFEKNGFVSITKA
ncbi:MAG: class I SAM-dependent methyltransferase [Agriterribacter sp.]